MSRITTAFSLLILVSSCAVEVDTPEVPMLEFGGKADNFYSDVAMEYEVSGSLPLTLTDAEYADVEARNDHVARRLTAVGLYLTTFVTDKFRGIDINGDGTISDDEVFFHNESYGGFHAMVRNYTVEPVEVGADAAGGYTAHFRIDVAGPRNLVELMSTLPGATRTGDGVDFGLVMPAGAKVDPEGVPRQVTRRFDPANHTGPLETIRCSMKARPEPLDAWPQYAAFMADGVYDLTLFFGHDYNTARYDLQEAREAFEHLRAAGFTPPVAAFEQLGSTSGPFTRDITANGRPVRVEVRIFHSDMFTMMRREQHDLAIAELVARDVFFYNGHAGPYYGFYLDGADQATVGYHELASVPFSADRQQLFIAQGCQTYSQYADMLYASPAKSEANLDVIVTVNYSYGQGTLALFDDLVDLGSDGEHVPRRYYEIVGALNQNWINDSYDVFYGVTGIDGNPQLHPYANVESLGQGCTVPSDCGHAAGNACVNHAGENVCAAHALGADACPDGSVFGVFEQEARTFGVCVAALETPDPEPEPTPSAPRAGELVITEIMADPKSVSDATGEWFEVLNVTTRPLALAGCQLGDDAGLTATLEGNVIIPPGAYATLARTSSPGFRPSYVYGSNYYIANRADEIVIQCADVVVDRVAYTGAVRGGATFSLSPEALDSIANDSAASFCYGVPPYAGVGSYQDKGTPGAANPACVR